MPIIPDETALGPRQAPVARRQIRSDRSGEIVAGAIVDAGEQLGRAAAIKQKKEDGLAYQRAKSALLTADLQVRRELEDVDDYTTWQKHYEDGMSKARSEAAKLIRSDHDRSIFDLDAGLDIEKGIEKVRGQALKREVDDDRAGLSDLLEKNRNAALEADPDSRKRFIEATKEAIKAAEEKGSITAVEAENMDSRWMRDTAEGMLVMMPAEQRAELLAKPEGTLAEVIPPDQRATMRQQALEENKITRNRAASQAESDRIMDTHESMADALAEARRITDPDVRALTVADVKSRFNEVEAIRADEDRARFESVANQIEEGAGVTDISPRDWANLSVNQRQALETRARQVATSEEPIHDDKKFYEWMQLPIEEQGKSNLNEWRPYFDDAHFDRAVARQRSILDAKEGNQDAKVSLTSALTIGQRVDRTLVSSGLFTKKPKAGSDEAVRWAQIESAIAMRIEQDSEAQGRKLKPQEIQQHIDDVVMDRYFIDEWGRDPEVLGVELTVEQAKDAYVPYDEIPDIARTRLENYAKSLGLTPNEDKIAKAYAAGKLRMGDERILELLQ